MKLLIIDDNAAVRTTLKLLLAGDFDHIAAVGDPALIPALLAGGDVDAVLLDMNFGNDRLDGADGIFWLSRIKEREDAPAVFTSLGGLVNHRTDQFGIHCIVRRRDRVEFVCIGIRGFDNQLGAVTLFFFLPYFGNGIGTLLL